MKRKPKIIPPADPHARAAFDAGGTLIGVNLSRDKFNADLARHYPGCGSPVRVPGTNGGFARCGSSVTQAGVTEPVFCHYCQPNESAACLVAALLDTSSSEINRAAAKAETPSDAEKETGNYKHGHVQLHGFDISIENAKDSERSGKDKDGKEWSVKMPAVYGYIKGTKGKDKDHLDVYIGPKPDSDDVFVVNQGNAEGAFDEHKIMLGFSDKAAAIKTYDAAFNDDLGPKLRQSVVATTIDGLKAWIADGDTKAPFKETKSESCALVECVLEGGSPKEFIRKNVNLPEPSSCGQKCYVCGNPCTRNHDHKNYRDLVNGTDEHICSRCDIRRFSNMLDQL